MLRLKKVRTAPVRLKIMGTTANVTDTRTSNVDRRQYCGDEILLLFTRPGKTLEYIKAYHSD